MDIAREVFEKKRVIMGNLAKAGFVLSSDGNCYIYTEQFMDGDLTAVIKIMPDGRVGLCEHYADSDMIGDIWHDAFDQQVCQSFKKEWPEIPECSTCGIYPECTRLEKCRVQVCYKELSDYRIWRTRKAMVNAYRAWKETEQ